MGAPVAASCLDWLIACGVRRVVAAGSCGALVDLPENAFVLPKRALRDEGTSFHYLPAARWIDLDGDVRGQIEDVFAAEGLPFVETDTWTTDAIFRETAEKIALRRAEGCGVVEMECAALAAVARFRGAKFGQFLYTADSLANAEAYDERDWGADSLAPALRLCLKAASEE
jgi:uridine phosphorylase